MHVGHVHSSICWPIVSVILTHLPWNHRLQTSQQIMNLLPHGFLQMHHKLKKTIFRNFFCGFMTNSPIRIILLILLQIVVDVHGRLPTGHVYGQSKVIEPK
jgi:hypothetical protein